MLKDNYAEYDRNKTRGVPREGKALLHGIIYCGECGHKMTVQYSRGTHYLCNHLRLQHGAPVCQSLRGDAIDDKVVEWFFDAMSVAEIDAASQALHDVDSDREQTLKVRRQQVERLRYHARLAERQFDKSDPDNRLVTGELERRWEEALRELKSAEESLARDEARAPTYAIPADLLEMLKDVGRGLPDIWKSDLLCTAQKKSLLRSLIDKVVLRRVHLDRVEVRVVWRGGANTLDVVTIFAGQFALMSRAKEMEAEIVKMVRAGDSDKTIAETLTTLGHRSPRSKVVSRRLVTKIRQAHGIFHRPNQCNPVRVEGYLTAPQIAKELGVPPEWIYYRIKKGTIDATKDSSTDCWVFPDKPETIQQFRKLREGKIDRIRS